MNDFLVALLGALVGALVGGVLSLYGGRQAMLFEQRANVVVQLQTQFDDIADELQTWFTNCYATFEFLGDSTYLEAAEASLPGLRDDATRINEKFEHSKAYYRQKKGWLPGWTRRRVEAFFNDTLRKFQDNENVVLRPERHSNYILYGREVVETAKPLYEWSRGPGEEDLPTTLAKFEEEVVHATMAPYRGMLRRAKNSIGSAS